MRIKALLSVLFFIGVPVFAKPVAIEIDETQPGAVINKYVYGQFAEHLGDGIYGGIYVGKDSSIPNTDGFRNDVINALKELQIPLVRWPGGCFADAYHWRDGIGPQPERPLTVNSSWGGTREDNSFGTHEFFKLVELLGADAYVNGNLGTGSPKEMVEWFEYITSDAVSPVTEERRKNGREKPWDMAFFAIGNEAWGCGGHMRPQYYADLYKHYATFLKAPHHNKPKLVASGGNDTETEWTEVLSDQVPASLMDGISFHFYTRPTDEVWEEKGKATGFPEREWISTLINTQKMDGFIKENIAVLDKNDPEGEFGFYVDEWGTWYDEDPATKGRVLYQRNTLRDAMVAALNFNIFHKYAERVHMTNIAQMVNVLQAMVLTDEEQMVLTPTYHAFNMYKVFQDATVLPYKTKKVPKYKHGKLEVDAISLSVARGQDGKVYLAAVNLDPNHSQSLDIKLKEAQVSEVEGLLLSAEAIDSENHFGQAPEVQPTRFSAGSQFTLPAKSLVVVELN